MVERDESSDGQGEQLCGSGSSFEDAISKRIVSHHPPPKSPVCAGIVALSCPPSFIASRASGRADSLRDVD